MEPAPPTNPLEPAPPAPSAPGPGGPPRSRLAILVVAGSILGFALLLVLANLSGGSHSQPSATDDPFAAFSKDDGKGGKGGKAGKAAKTPKSTKARVDPASLMVQGPTVQRPTPPAGAKNVVLIVLTAVRKDGLSPYGASPDRSPYLLELAAKGARFTDLLSASPFSRQAAVAYLTGRFAAETGTVEPGASTDESVLPNDVDTLAERFQAAGWRTYGATANQNLNVSGGFGQGFDQYRNAPTNGFTPPNRVDGDELVPAALDLLARRSPEDAARPFYLQVDLIDAHAPLKVMKEVEQRFDPDQPNAAYRVAIWNVDKYVADLVRGLGDAGHDIKKDTYVVLISDHGEGNDDPPHHGKMHGFTLYESVMDVPWIVDGPDVPPNRLIGGLASQVDVMPTILGLAGVPAPTGIDGQSWADQIRGKGDKTTRERAFSDTWFLGAARAAIWTDGMECQKDYGSVGMHDTFADGCYDRRTDPLFTNLKQDPALQTELDAWRAKVTAHVGAATPAPGEASAPGDGQPATPPDGQQAG